MKRRIFSLLMATAMLLALMTGCSRPTTPTPPPDPNSGASAPEFVLRIGTSLQSSSPAAQLYETVFKPYIEETSGGRIEVQTYHDSTMGSDAQLIEAMQLGTIEMGGVPTSVVSNFCPDFMALDMPFLYADRQTVYAALDGAFGDTFFSKLEPINIKGLSWTENGFRNFSANKPIRTLEDMAGLKIRVMEAPVYLETMKAFGANPTPMAFSELYTGLSQGTVVAQDNGIILTYSARLYEVQDYYTIINYIYAPACNLVSKAWWDSLPADLQEIVAEGSQRLADGIRESNQALEEEYLGLMQEAGVEVIYIEDAERDRFREACSGVYDTMRGLVEDPTVIDLALEVNETYGN